MAEVEPNGGLKLLCVLGRILLFSDSGKFELLPGELVFAKPGGLGMGDKINVNLGTVVESSYLLSGFPNSPSFQNSLANAVEAQKNSIGKTYRAEVGKGSKHFRGLAHPRRYARGCLSFRRTGGQIGQTGLRSFRGQSSFRIAWSDTQENA